MVDNCGNSPAEIVITPMRTEHLLNLADMEKAAFSEPWSYDALAEELQNPLAVFFVAEDSKSKRAIGYLGMHHIVDEGYITNIVVDPGCRRRGIASALIKKASEYARSHELKRITLEVRTSNEAAIALYGGFGFKRDGIRPNFYSYPKEDAAIYSLRF